MLAGMATRRLLRSTAVTGGMTLLSRVSGLVRDVVFANLLGAGAGIAADAFYVAFRVPNFLRRIFGEGAFSQAFVPVLAEYRTRRSAEETRFFLDHVAGWMGSVLFGLTLLGVLAAPLVVSVLAPGFRADPVKYQLTVDMLRLTFPYIFFISLVAMAAGILNTYGRFAAAAFTPVLLNLCLIGAALLLAPHLSSPVMALAWGVFIAGAVQLLFQLPFLSQLQLLPRPRVAIQTKDEGVSRVFRLMLPAIFGVSIAQINLLLNTLLASFLVTGSVAWLYYSDRLMEFPVGVFGIALASVILPSLADKHANRSSEEFSRLLDFGLRWAVLICIPAAVALIVLAGPLVATIYHHGRFTGEDVHMSVLALIAFAVGLPPLILIKVLAPGFYARQDTKTPMRIGVVAMLVNIGVALCLTLPPIVAGLFPEIVLLQSLRAVFPFAHVGLALAITVSAFVNAALLYRWLRRHQAYTPLAGWTRFLVNVFAATATMGLVLWWGVGAIGEWIASGTWQRIGRLAFWVVAGIVIYGIMILALGLRPAQLAVQRGPGMFKDE
ncbi:MAG TPA: murein biosynthesis integral membrane protein MurJ [Burkholderiales bacterium]|nr:murein biosynthesis integral membrane protein MurJ [Burkholderiales bacterium]